MSLYTTKNNITVPSKIHVKLIELAYSPDSSLL
jgi:hypothetical protein